MKSAIKSHSCLWKYLYILIQKNGFALGNLEDISRLIASFIKKKLEPEKAIPNKGPFTANYKDYYSGNYIGIHLNGWQLFVY